MDKENRQKIERAAWGLILALGVTVFILGTLVLSGGCTRTVYKPVETVRTEYRDRETERLVSDTVHDTRIVWIKGDTVVDIREKERISHVEIHDTCYIERCDTIRIPCPVERKLSRWEQAKMDAGGIAIGVLCAAVITFVVVWIIKIKRRK